MLLWGPRGAGVSGGTCTPVFLWVGEKVILILFFYHGASCCRSFKHQSMLARQDLHKSSWEILVIIIQLFYDSHDVNTRRHHQRQETSGLPERRVLCLEMGELQAHPLINVILHEHYIIVFGPILSYIGEFKMQHVCLVSNYKYIITNIVTDQPCNNSHKRTHLQTKTVP